MMRIFVGMFVTTIAWLTFLALAAPQYPHVIPNLIDNTQESTTNTPVDQNVQYNFVGSDRISRNITGTPCTIGECTFFILCTNGTIQTHRNGLAYRGPNRYNMCPKYDDVCCVTSKELVDGYYKKTKLPILAPINKL